MVSIYQPSLAANFSAAAHPTPGPWPPPTPTFSIKYLWIWFPLLQINAEQVALSLPDLILLQLISDAVIHNLETLRSESTWPVIHRSLIWNAWCRGGRVGGRVRNKFPDPHIQRKWGNMGGVGGAVIILWFVGGASCPPGTALRWGDLGWPHAQDRWNSSSWCLLFHPAFYAGSVPFH